MNNPLNFDHLGYIATAYGLFAAATIYFAAGAQMRLARVARRLRTADPRQRGEK
jgi:hypothetical protein